MALLEVSDLTAGYGRTKVLHNISIAVEAGSVCVILGSNGAGKTTTLRAISGLIRGTGTVVLNGLNVINRGPAGAVRAGIAHVPEGRGTFADLTVAENLLIGGYRHGRQQVKADIESVYETFPQLGDLEQRRAGTLSGGEQQMLAVGRGLMLRPKLLLLDEPSLGLAPIITKQLFAVLDRARKEWDTSILLVEQNVNLAAEIADVAYLMESGRIVGSGEAQDVLSDDTVRRAYLGY